MPKQVSHRPGHSRFVVPRSKHDALETGQHDRARAHRAWLERPVQCAGVASPTVEFGRRLAYGEQLGVSGRVLVAEGSIARRRDYRSVANDNRAYRDLVPFYRLAGEIERIPDVLF